MDQCINPVFTFASRSIFTSSDATHYDVLSEIIDSGFKPSLILDILGLLSRMHFDVGMFICFNVHLWIRSVTYSKAN